jgi:predicted amino acid racemase
VFVDALLQQNLDLVEWSIYAHRTGRILPNTYVLDLDAIRRNASVIKETADNFGLQLYMMTKQIGRIPVVCKTIAECGIPRAVAVSIDEARALHRQGFVIGHLGHLMQIPEWCVDEALAMDPEVITVMDIENAKKISRHANKSGRRQQLLLRVTEVGDTIYPQQYGGVSLEQLPMVIEEIQQLEHVELVGFTAFPCFALGLDSERVEPTHNFHTLRKAVDIGRNCGCRVQQVNAPGGNDCATFSLAAGGGVTHLEPGHAFTGTTYRSATSTPGVEIMAMAYVTEVSHKWNGKSCVFGGGFYGRAKIHRAIVAQESGYHLVNAENVQPGNIDYYAQLECSEPVGTGVLYAFRTQLFVVNASIAVVEGLRTGAPRMLGIFDKYGNQLN